ncbi:MAG: HAD family phosphatase [Spirochaetaceae bacterium]|nr:MAG: HAD family phosphatase [Spirochaetaceae bacterium]
MKLPKAVLFDFDGVLVDSSAYHFRMWSAAFEELFGRPVPEYRNEHIRGLASHEIAAIITGLAGVPDRSDDLYQQRLVTIANSPDAPDPAPGSLALTGLLEKHATPYAVVSNAPSVYVSSACKALGFAPAVRLGVDDFEGRYKPDPWPYLHAAERLGFETREFESLLVVEDSATGVRAGVSAGIPVLGLSRDGDADLLYDAGARDVISDLTGIRTVISGL